MAAYWMVRGGEIKDQQALVEYGKLWGPIAERFQARIITKGDHQTPEGSNYPRVLIVEFPDFQQAVACYEDSEYKNAMAYANKAYDRELTIIDGV